MEGISLTVVLVIAMLVFGPVLLFMPLVRLIANRIAGKTTDAKALNELRERVAKLEGQPAHLNTRVLLVEDTQEFHKKLEDQTSRETK